MTDNKIDTWRLKEFSISQDIVNQGESLFALGNGYLGLRGNFEQGDPVYQNGTYVNGFYEYRKLHYGEEAFGYAKNSQTMINLTDCKIIRLYIDGEPLNLLSNEIIQYERTLDMKEATLMLDVIWKLSSGVKVKVRSTRFVSLHRKHLGIIKYEVTLLNVDASIIISSEMISNESIQLNEWDPREVAKMHGQVLNPDDNYCSGQSLFSGHTTSNSLLSLACLIDHTIITNNPYHYRSHSTDSEGKVVYEIEGAVNQTVTLYKHMAYYTGKNIEKHKLEDEAHECINSSIKAGYDLLLFEHKIHVDHFWKNTDIVIEGDDVSQRGLRFSLFHIFQSVGKSGTRGIAAKGLTGQGYEGHYFWDTEIYVIPFMIYTNPLIARNLLIFRHSMLPLARKRARTLSHKGALFPWRTISGEEASAYFPAGTAQYHINADIAYAIKKYMDITNDHDFLIEYGAEILLETARFWLDFGFYSDSKNGKFCINGVTGPDEYTALVNNNAYTNLMARENLWFAAEVITNIQHSDPDTFDRLNVDSVEMDKWQHAADNMYIPPENDSGVIPQDDSFLDKKKWDFEGTPKENYPLLLHYHPLVLYRHQVLKQSDLLLSMFLLRKYFTNKQIQLNFDYYDPLTTGDSSLSDCVQGIIASHIGRHEKTYDYFMETVEMDLENINHNVKDGVHIASMAGSWLYIVYGFLGMQDDDGIIRFNPQLPSQWTSLTVSLRLKGQTIAIKLSENKVEYTLKEGRSMTIQHFNQRITLQFNQPVTAAIIEK